jgi:hypothetical protein
MKRIIFISIVLSVIFINSLSAQEYTESRNTFKISAGLADFNGTSGFIYQNEYVREITGFISLGAKFAFSMATDVNPNAYRSHQSMSSLNLALYFTPLNIENHKILFGGGVGYNYYQQTYRLGFGTSQGVTYYNETKYNTGYGYNFLMAYEFTFLDKYIIGINGSAVTFDDVVGGYGLILGYKF